MGTGCENTRSIEINCDLQFEDGNYWWNIIKRDHVPATHLRSDSHVAVLSS